MQKTNKQLKVLVLGGSGFIGSQVVQSLTGRANVIVGTRKTTTEKHMLSVQMQEMLEKEDWQPILTGVDVVVNSVGILRERKNETYEQVHTLAVKALALACLELGITLIQVSAIGLSDSAKSRFIQSKLAGEQAILSSGVKATIVRPSLLDGEGGYGAKWFRMVAAWSIQFVMQSEGLVAPLQVSDLGQAIANLSLMPVVSRPSIVELGGSKIYDIPNYLTTLRQTKGKTAAIQISMPKLVVRMVSHIFDLLNWTPLSFGHYELMQGYNVPNNNALPQLLGQEPSRLGEGRGLVAAQNEVLI